MSKAKFALRPIVSLLLIISLLSIFPRSTYADELKWSRVNIPSNGQTGKWVLAAGSDVRYITPSSNGTIYCYATPTGTSYRLFKSTDNGLSWSYTGRVEDVIVDIATVPGKPNSVYYATTSKIFRSTDAGNNFNLITRNPGGAGAGNVEITSLDVATADGGEFVVVGTRDTDAGQWGGVYTFEESQSFETKDAGLGSFDVYCVAFSPNFALERQIVVVATNEADTIVTAKIYNSTWGLNVANARISGLVPVSAALAFPGDYTSSSNQGKYTEFIALNTGGNGGDVYCLKGRAPPASSQITDLNVGSAWGFSNLDITSLAVSGNGDKTNLLAGTASTAQVYFSEDAGIHWMPAAKPPSGASNTYISISADFVTSGVVYAATGGAESAFSVSRDKGNTWNQLSLIDTAITNILDLETSPAYKQDNSLFLLTAGLQNSLWYTQNSGGRWERLYSSGLPQVDRINQVTISPNYNQNKTVYLSGISNTVPVIWKSANNGQNFQRMPSSDPKTGGPVNIDLLTVTPDDVIMVGSYDGVNGLIYQIAGGGLYYSQKSVVGSLPLNSMVLSPDFIKDKTILVGDTSGSIYISEDSLNFDLLPVDIASPPLSGAITVAFDPDYSRNKTVYAASDTADKGIYRFIVDKSTAWETVDRTLPAGAKIGQLGTSPSGTLYAVYSRNVAGQNNKGGIERSLDPTYNLGPTFETITNGVDDGVSLNKLWIQSNNLWTIDLTNLRLLTYTDSVISSITLTSPADNAPGLGTRNVMISWKSLSGANSYHWQLDTDRDFYSVPAGFEGDSDSTSARLPTLESDTIYYWRVRANNPITSPWSDKRSFTTVLSTQVIAPDLIEPEANVLTTIKPNFRWSAFAGADRYDLQVAEDENFSNLVVNKTGSSASKFNAWKCDLALKNSSTYYWRVRAVSGSNNNDWAVSIFTTEAVPVPSVSASPVQVSPLAVTSSPPPPAAPSITPAQTSSLESTIGWLFFLVGGLVVLTIILIVVVVVMLRKFRNY